jgi:hypothetical protein
MHRAPPRKQLPDAGGAYLPKQGQAFSVTDWFAVSEASPCCNVELIGNRLIGLLRRCGV